MTEQSFGVLSILYALIPVLSTAASLGIEQTLKRFQPEYLRSGQVGLADWLVRRAAVWRLISNIVLLAAILLLWRLVAPIFQLTEYRPEFAIFAILILFHFQASLLQLSLSSHMLQQYAVGLTALLSIVKLVGYALFIAFSRLTLIHAILVDLAAYAAMYACTRYAHWRYCTPPAPERLTEVSKSERSRLLKFGAYNNFNDVGSMILTSKSDNFFIAAFLSPIAAGAYSFYTRLVEMSSQILPIRLFSNVIQPMFFSVPKEESRDRIPRYVTFLFNTTFVLQLPIAAYMTVYHREIVQLLFGGKFVSDSWLLPLVAWMAAANRISDPVTYVAQYEEKTAILLASKLFVFYNLATMVLLIPVAGIYGAAISTGTAQIFKNLFVWWRVRDLARWTNFKAFLLCSCLVWGSAMALAFAAKSVAHRDWISLAIGALIFAAATATHVRTPAISESDRNMLSSLFRGPERRILFRLGLVKQPA